MPVMLDIFNTNQWSNRNIHTANLNALFYHQMLLVDDLSASSHTRTGHQ